jgi:hypothetical protein
MTDAADRGFVAFYRTGAGVQHQTNEAAAWVGKFARTRAENLVGFLPAISFAHPGRYEPENK